ncbi:MAG: hydroxyacylglutathione hydrolase, partial [Blastocatellia bacterium]|nr:hydroxyacylglutathione hydrolase [Blastocatellia bacterium]
TSSTIGEQKKLNYALTPMTKEAFITMMTVDLPPAPDYFSKDAEINRSGAATLAEIARPAALSPSEVEALAASGHVLLDVRSAADFGAGHVPGSVNIGLGGQFAIWSGSLLSMTTPIVIVAESVEKVDEAVMRLARVGIETVEGYLAGGVETWRQAGLELAQVPQVSVDELHTLIEDDQVAQILDVRRPLEFEGGHVPRAIPAPLSELREKISQLPFDPAKPTAVICAGGYRSSAASSILQQQGFRNLLNVAGGTAAWIKAGHPVE